VTPFQQLSRPRPARITEIERAVSVLAARPCLDL
jgi:hypothetical protein